MPFRSFRPWLPVLFLLCAGAAATAGPQAPAERSSYWRERTSLFRTLPGSADVVMIGDSLTDGAEWAELFPRQRIVNRGIDSDTTDGVLARLDDIIAARPRQAFLMIGINDFADLHRDVDAVYADYRAIVAKLRHAGVQVVVQSTLPCNEAKGAWKSCAAINGKIGRLDARLATLAAGSRLKPGITGSRFIDLRPVLAPHGQLKDEFTYDGIHLNGEGYRHWQRTIAPLMPALPPNAVKQ
jgi:lysophospholipase L1-like esterase